MITHSLHSAPTAERIHDEDERVNPATAGVGDAPRRKMFGKTKLHSLRYVSYSIPLACIMTIFATFFIIRVPSASAAASASLSVDGVADIVSEQVNAVVPGETAYSKVHTISVSGSNIEKYELVMSTGTGASSNLKSWGDSSGTYWGYTENDNLTEANKTSQAYAAVNKTWSSTNASGFSKKVAFAAKFANNATPGVYSARVNFSLIATPATVTYTISYNANGGSNAPSSTICRTEGTVGTNCTTNLSSNKPTKTNYKFLGWANSNNATTKQYDAGGNITVNANKTLYAVYSFDESVVQGFGGITKMQDMTSSICSGAATNTSGQLYDSRDDSTYTVKKLSDGKCWMTQNLRLTRETIKAKDSSNTTGKVTSADTNTNSDYSIPASTTGAFSSTQDSNSHYTNQQVRASSDNDYGAYYSYNVATLNKVSTSNSGTATYDICPKGWRLPTGNSSGEFQALYNKGKSSWTTNNGKNGYWLGGSSSSASGAAFFPAAGYVDTSGLIFTGSLGYYWSSTISTASLAYYLYFYSGGIYPAYNDPRYLGFSVRCVAK